MVLEKFLEPTCEVEIAADAESGLKKCQSKVYDLILMDIHLGKDKMTGIEAMKIIKTYPDYQSVPIIAFTAYALPEDRDYYLELGFSDYIPKPADKATILKVIDTYTG